VKWMTLQKREWQEVAPYVDTLILPLYTLRMQAKQFDVERGKQLEQVIDLLEHQCTGRVLWLPAVPVIASPPSVSFSAYMIEWATELVQSGFTYLILLTDGTISIELEEEWKSENRLFFISLQQEEEIEQQVENIYQQILHLWERSYEQIVDI
jgi:hypothetical protein